jgi:thiamine transport system substrate-binding protein
MRFIRLLLIVLGLLLSTACRDDAPPTVTLMTHDSFSISEAVLADFEAQSGYLVELLPAGDAGEMLNQAILTRDQPLADVIYGIDNTFMSRALAADILLPAAPAGLAAVAPALQLDITGRLVPINYGDVCLNYDTAYFADAGLPPPTALADLVDPAYRGLLVVEDPATSSPGLAFLLTTLSAFGTDGELTWLDYWAALRANDVLVTSSWTDAYYTHFSAASEGNRPIVVSYATSPPAEVLFADTPPATPPSANVLAAGTCFRQVEFAGILAGTEEEEGARALLDFMLTLPFQEDIPLNMFVLPANGGATVPDIFSEVGGVAVAPATVDPAALEANREAWIEAWADTVLR